jgi:hypothetical protein
VKSIDAILMGVMGEAIAKFGAITPKQTAMQIVHIAIIKFLKIQRINNLMFLFN